MPESQAPDLTYVTAPAFVQRMGQRPAGPEVAASSRESKAVTSISGGGYVFLHSQMPPSGGGNWAFRSEPRVTTGQAPEAPPAPVVLQVDAVAEQRVRLLARKYQASASAEDLARLEILNNRLNRLAPRTTASDIERVEKTADEVTDIKAKLDAFAAEYGA